MKEKIALTLAVMMAAAQMAVAAPHGHMTAHNEEVPYVHAGEVAFMPNPWMEHESLSKAQKAAGLKLDIPSDIDRGIPVNFRTMDEENKVLEVIYRDAAGRETARIRKAFGSYDISGDHVGYTSLERVAVGCHEAAIKGFDRNFAVAVWEDNGYSYSLHLDRPVSRTVMRHLLADIE